MTVLVRKLIAESQALKAWKGGTTLIIYKEQIADENTVKEIENSKEELL